MYLLLFINYYYYTSRG